MTLTARELLGELNGLVCDLDGVVYRGDAPIEGAVACLQELARREVHIVFCTNNSTQTPQAYERKLRAMGLDPALDDIVTSPTVTREVLVERGLAGKDAIVIGGDGVRQAVEEAGLALLPPAATEANVVIVGLDRSFTYDKLNAAARAVRGGADFIATNDDATYPAEEGLDPGAGTIIAAIERASGRRAEVLGKPHKPMMESVARRFPSGARLAMVGDRAETDLEGALAMGWTTILVLSGVTDEKAAQRLEPQLDLILRDLGDLLNDQ
jgi:4-nitrophenyl phosphatase